MLKQVCNLFWDLVPSMVLQASWEPKARGRRRIWKYHKRETAAEGGGSLTQSSALLTDSPFLSLRKITLGKSGCMEDLSYLEMQGTDSERQPSLVERALKCELVELDCSSAVTDLLCGLGQATDHHLCASVSSPMPWADKFPYLIGL